MWNEWWIIPAVLGGIYLMLWVFALLGLLQMLNPVKKLSSTTTERSLLPFLQENQQWFSDHPATYRGCYQVGLLTLHVLGLSDNETELVLVQAAQAKCIMFNTHLADKGSLVSTNYADTETTPPPPRCYRQTMTDTTLDTLYDYHQESLRFLSQMKSLLPTPFVPEEELQAEIQNDARKEARLLLTYPRFLCFMPIYYLTRHWRCNRTIKQQFGRNPQK